MAKKLRAIDLYSGIGGWSLGLKLAGISVVGSYERWPTAVDTYNANLGTNEHPVDIRKLKLNTLPPNIDIVVGSPPCTEFSFSNRGGNGNVAEGVIDIVQFLKIVTHLKPKYWVMENVPRVAEVVRTGLQTPSHPLYQFRNLALQIETINFAVFGLPQNRLRCIIGNIPFDLLNAYKPRRPSMSLGKVVSALGRKRIVKDPIWGIALPKYEVTEMETEGPLDAEQVRMNRDAKAYHPVYNNMAFPDSFAAPSRTVTATCTRVSRESIIIPDTSTMNAYRRLSVRERASLQGFPITYQFYSQNHSDKMKLIGNAVPPLFSYLVASAIRGIAPKVLPSPSAAGAKLTIPNQKAPTTTPNGRGLVYPAKRTFRAAIPHLRFKSGMRFELANEHSNNRVRWCIRFFFGPSTDILTIDLDKALFNQIRRKHFIQKLYPAIEDAMFSVSKYLDKTSPKLLQEVWAHKNSGLGPYMLTDRLGAASNAIHRVLQSKRENVSHYVLGISGFTPEQHDAPGARKFTKHSTEIMSGLILGAWFNTHEWHDAKVRSRPKAR